QAPQTARITSIEQAQRLYNAILALPLVPRTESCIPELLSEYQIVFQATHQVIPSIISKKCNTISLEGQYQSRGGTYVMNDQFKQLFAQTLAGASFAPARPDRLSLLLEPEKGQVSQSVIADTELMQKLYTKVFLLPTSTPLPDCPSEKDKVAGKGKWYVFSFT